MSNIFHNVKSLVSLTIFGSERVNIVIILAHCRVNWQEVMKGEEGVEVRIRKVGKIGKEGELGVGEGGEGEVATLCCRTRQCIPFM